MDEEDLEVSRLERLKARVEALGLPKRATCGQDPIGVQAQLEYAEFCSRKGRKRVPLNQRIFVASLDKLGTCLAEAEAIASKKGTYP